MTWTVSSLDEGHKVSLASHANSYSAKCNFNKSLTLSAEEEPAESFGKIKIYPNPTNNIAYIDLNNNDVTAKGIVVFDSFGKIYSIESTQSNDQQIEVNLTGLNPGLYFVKVTLGDTFEILRIVKQ